MADPPTATDDLSDDDDMPILPSDTLAHLQRFYSARDDALSRYADMRSDSSVSQENQQPLSMAMFAEDWNASQFWYDDATATALAKELLRGATGETRVVVVSCPSVFVKVVNLMRGMESHERPRMVKLLEFDERFEVLAGFVKFDFERPLHQLPEALEGAFDRVLIDPPYHSEDCLRKFAKTVQWLSDSGSSTTAPKIVVCTGESMEEVIEGVFDGVFPTTFEILHEQGRLKSEYFCYANFECGAWSWKAAGRGGKG